MQYVQGAHKFISTLFNKQQIHTIKNAGKHFMHATHDRDSILSSIHQNLIRCNRFALHEALSLLLLLPCVCVCARWCQTATISVSSYHFHFTFLIYIQLQLLNCSMFHRSSCSPFFFLQPKIMWNLFVLHRFFLKLSSCSSARLFVSVFTFIIMLQSRWVCVCNNALAYYTRTCYRIYGSNVVIC